MWTAGLFLSVPPVGQYTRQVRHIQHYICGVIRTLHRISQTLQSDSTATSGGAQASNRFSRSTLLCVTFLLLSNGSQWVAELLLDSYRADCGAAQRKESCYPVIKAGLRLPIFKYSLDKQLISEVFQASSISMSLSLEDMLDGIETAANRTVIPALDLSR